MPISQLRRAGHWPTLVASLVHFDVSFMVWVLLGALGAYVARDLGLSPAQKGLMVAVPPLGGAAFRLVLGTVADRVGLKRTGLVSLALTLVPLAWGALAGGTYAQVLGIGLLLGIAGASFAVALPIVGRWYSGEHQGLALGIAGAGNSGTIVAMLAAPRLAEHVGWHGVFAVAAVPVALAWVVFAAFAREPARPTAPARSSLALLAEPDARWLAAFYLVTFGGFVGLSGYLPMFFVDRFGVTPVQAAWYAAAAAAAGSLLRPLGGALADRRGGTHVLQLVFGALAVLAAALASQPALVPTVALLALALGTFGLGNGAVFQLVPKRFPDHIGAVTGLVGAVGGVGGFVLALGFGALAQATGSFGAGFLAVAVVALAARAGVVGRRRVWRGAWQVEVAI
jgi:NNP family nitrate/nitrite transporter-like MFS transporter